MTTLTTIATIWLLHLLTTLSPGPAFLIVAQTSMSRSTRAGVATAIGLGMGTLSVAAVGLLGSGVLLQLHSKALWIIKIISGSYLAWIGLRLWLKSKEPIDLQESSLAKSSQLSSFFDGFIVNLFNPKVVLLFLSLFTTVITPMTPVWVRVLILLLVTLNASLWYSTVAVFLSTSYMRQRYSSLKPFLDRIFGATLFGGGLWLTQRG